MSCRVTVDDAAEGNAFLLPLLDDSVEKVHIRRIAVSAYVRDAGIVYKDAYTSVSASENTSGFRGNRRKGGGQGIVGMLVDRHIFSNYVVRDTDIVTDNRHIVNDNMTDCVIYHSIVIMGKIRKKMRSLPNERKCNQQAHPEAVRGAFLDDLTIGEGERNHLLHPVNHVDQDNTPTLPTLEKLCGGFGITLAQFFDDDTLTVTPEEKLHLQRWEQLSSGECEGIERYIDYLLTRK